ncbi:lysozyme-like protein 4 isoform X1 [Canis lupus familiaris]|nr:lysozyme-like protein 4 isoform X1 [Canis lupus familiaris]XP_038313345.1 lysozyme-like protein 4 isoform X1 [Canis lupus familiaris]XP_038426479.1 lysozyme-like protein 4 isoform X1 [Canis lupus familiaris]
MDSVTPPAYPATIALSCQEPEKMKASVVLSLIGYLVVPSGAAILGRCVVAKKLYDGGLNYFEGYSLENWVCLAYFESKFNPMAIYENLPGGYTGYGLFQIRDWDWCDRGRNLCHMSCSALLNPNLKKTIECAKKIVKGKDGMGAWPSWSLNCRFADNLARWLDGCRLYRQGWPRQHSPVAPSK